MDVSSALSALETACNWLNAIAARGHDLQASWGVPDQIGFFSSEAAVPGGVRTLEAFCYLFVISTFGVAFPLAHVLFPSKQQKKDLWCDRRALWVFLLIFWVEFCLMRAFCQWATTWKVD